MAEIPPTPEEPLSNTPLKPKPRKRRPRQKPLNKNNDENNEGLDDVNRHHNEGEVEGEKVKQRKSRPRTTAFDYSEASAVTPSTKSRRFNGTVLASAKPSYCFRRGIGSCLKDRGESIRTKHKKTLRRLLKRLIRQRNWAEATGVLGVLIKATTKDKSASHNRNKYWATMELLKHIKGDNINSRKIQNVYDLWMKKVGSIKNRTAKERFSIQLEYIIFCLTRGDVEDAHQAALCLMQERGFESDPISNLFVGLTFYELWYSDLPEEWKLELNDPGVSVQPESSEAGASMSSENSDEYDAIESHEDNFPLQTNSDSSVANDKDMMEVDSHQPEEVLRDVNDDQQRQTPQQSSRQEDFYVYSAEGSGDEKSSSPTDDGYLPYVSIFHTHGVPPWLLPLRMPPSNDNLDDFLYMHRKLLNGHYKSALKHLRVAVHSTPPVVEALHPLIQMLLIGDRVNEALDELENFSHDSAATIKLRLKAGLLEHFDRGNCLQLSSCYEGILEVDPMCSHSLARLVNMHRKGEYSTEKLAEMLALHLDATCAECNIWKELSTCLLKLAQCAGDQMSICLNGDEDESQKNSTPVNQIPELFTHGESGNTWRFRSKWWLSRYFSTNILASEVAAGDLELLTYKAAVAAFLYGRGFKYVVKVCDLLQKENNRDMYSILQMHVKNSVGIYNYERK